MSHPYLGGLSDQQVKLLSRGEALFDPVFRLAFAQHAHQFNPDQSLLRRPKGLEPEHRAYDPLHAVMVLFHQIIEIAYLTDSNGRPMRLVVSTDG